MKLMIFILVFRLSVGVFVMVVVFIDVFLFMLIDGMIFILIYVW